MKGFRRPTNKLPGSSDHLYLPLLSIRKVPKTLWIREPLRVPL
jgi:hypothetical protein